MATDTTVELRFEKVDGGYDVWLLNGREWAPLGTAERTTVSTDTQIAGTRLRRPGKGRTAWRARVPMEEARAVGGRGGREIVVRGWRERTYDVEWTGENFETRTAAVEALVGWHEHPELRRGPAARR